MEIEQVKASEYEKIVKANVLYDRMEFNELNAYKVDEVCYLLFKEENKYVFGLTAGRNGQELRAPFSAPFALLVPIKRDRIVEKTDNVCSALKKYLIDNSYKMVISLPPTFYDTDLITALLNGLSFNGFRTEYIDMNFSFELESLYELDAEEFGQRLPRNGRKNLRIALQSGLSIRHCDTIADIEKAYLIIKSNRMARGYPLRMSYQQVADTIKLTGHDFFTVQFEGEMIAAAQIFYVTEKIAQVIYWGDIPGYSEHKPVNFLAYELIRYYGKRGFDFLDIGPSTERGMPNIGLCNFKNSIGCGLTPKVTLSFGM